MSMDPIKRLTSPDPLRVIRPNPRPGHNDDAASPGEEAADRLDLSEAAQTQLQLVTATAVGNGAQAHGGAADADRAGEIRRRIEQGYYQRVDVVGSIVDALLKSRQHS